MLDSAAKRAARSDVAVASITAPTIHVYLIGDSTMADRADPETIRSTDGASCFPRFFDDSVRVHNHAVNGRSTKSFIDEGRGPPCSANSSRATTSSSNSATTTRSRRTRRDTPMPRGVYRRNLERFVSEARAKGAVPILFTPIVRRKFDAHGALEDTHGAYPVVVRAVAKDLRVPFIDLQALTDTLVRSAGPEDSKRLYVWLGPGASKFFPEGRQDDTHLSVAGATAVARLAARELAQVGDPIGRHVRGID